MTHTNQSTDTLRLWPAIVAAGLILPVRFLLPIAWPDVLPFAVVGAVVFGLAVMLWWAFFSKAPRGERLGGFALMIAALVAAWALAHESIATGAMGMLLPLLAIPVLGLLLPIWAMASRRLSTHGRFASMTATIVIAIGVWALVRTDGMTSSLIGSDFHWRWTPTAEERLLATATPMPVPAAPSAPVAAAPVASAAAPTVGLEHENVSATANPPRESAGLGASAPAPAVPLPIVEWPGFRGAVRDGVIRRTRIDTDWAATPPSALWRRPIGPGWSSFAVFGDLLYTQEQRGEQEIVAAYSLATGQPVWAHQDAVRFWESNGGAGPRATPTVDRERGRVYAFGATGILNALDAKSGVKIWAHDVAADSAVPVPDWGFSSSPLLLDDMVIVAAAGKLVAYDTKTGGLQWTSSDRGPSYSSPHLLTLGGVPQIVLLTGRGAVSVAPTTGAILWEFDLPPSAMAATIVQPAMAADGDLLVSDGQASSMHRIAVANSPGGWTVAERWATNRLKPLFNDFVVHNGHAYGFDGTILACIDLADGNRKWKGGRYGNGQLLLLADQDLLLVTSEEGELILVNATPDGFTERARTPGIEGKTWNHPALAGDVLLMRNGEEMAAFRLPSAPQKTASPPPGITRTALIDNETVMMARLRMAPGAAEDLHTHPFSAVVIQLDAGDVDMRLGETRSTSHRPAGFVEYIAREAPHAAANVGKTAFDVVTVAIKPDRKRGGEAPAQPAPAGITRSPLLDNADARVTRVEFAPGAREPVHSHPFDLVVVPLTAGRLEVRVAERVETRDYAAGEPIFLPRDVPHAVSNVGGMPVTVFSVGVK
jgi:quercetin dioxygenase-like cupin family protein